MSEQPQKLIKNSIKEIEAYMREISACSVDSISLLTQKVQLHKDFIELHRDFNINDDNEYLFDEIKTLMEGIRKVKGETPFELIMEKFYIFQDNVMFLKEVTED